MEVALKSNNSAVKTGVNKTTAKSVPAFLNKLFAQVGQPETDGDSFLIPSADRFAKEVLPCFFKHSNFGSFVPSLQQGALKGDDEVQELLEFSNPNFLQAQPDLLCFIQRQKSRNETGAEAGALDLPALLTDLASIRKHQTAISADLKDLQQSNHALWQEAIQSRERHARQQETLNKILRFLATVFGGQVAGGEQGESPPGGSGVVLEEETGVDGEGCTNGGAGGKGKGKGPAQARAVAPKMRSQLLLEDVKGRQDDRAKHLRTLSARIRDEADDDDDEEEDIEKIPSSRASDELPTISSAPRMPSIASTSRAPTTSKALVYPGNSPDASRFTTIPTPDSNRPSVASAPGDSPADPDYHLSQDAINNMFGDGSASSANQDALVSFLQSRSQPSATPTSGTGASNTLFPGAIDMPSFPRTPGGNNIDFSRALIPSSPALAAPTSNPLDALTSETGALFSPSDFSPDYRSAIRDSTQAIQDVTNEKADIDARTSALEAAIARLMQNLPEETREQLSQQTGQGLDELSTSGNGSWSSGANGDLDLDKFLAQYDTNPTSGQTPIDYSMYFDPDASAGSPGLSGLGNLRSSGPQFQTLSPSYDDDDDEDDKDEEEEEEEEEEVKDSPASTSKGLGEVKADEEAGTRETTPNQRAGSKTPSTPKATTPKKGTTTAKATKTTGAKPTNKKRKSEVVEEVEVATLGGSRKSARSRR
ncbi:BQ2448_4171 [Microbotryum intermedium]|uniref:BQ2448_4171 protein n=1 Tax=Microbotryum intermedium TaxID=269621 RepID=A0A238FL83_9BASI|nr:BQ2448_4171 [Microbotryum intermedium]